MEIKYVNINELKDAEYNPRKLSDDQFNQIRKSLVEFGFVDPIIINKDNTIIGGHSRVKVWKSMGQKEVPAVYLDLSKDKEKELNIRLNKNTGDWDWNLLMDNFDVNSLIEYGFEEKEINMVLKRKKLIWF